MTTRAAFMFGLCVGAWLNIWPPLFGDWWGFIFAYVLVFAALAVIIFERGTA